jgi:hypothetical protein
MPPIRVEDLARVVLEDSPEAFLELMVRELGIPPEHLSRVRGRLEKMHDSLHQRFVHQMKEILKDRHLDILVLSHHGADHDRISEIKQHLYNDLLQKEPTPVATLPLTPELQQWAQRQHTEEEIVAGLREAREQNGPELNEVVRRLEQELRERERAKP